MKTDAGVGRPWTWAVGNITLELREGDLLQAPESAIVNSEQTNFVLNPEGWSVSAQLNRAWPSMQDELDRQVGGRWQPEGTVLETSGPGGRRVYHAGFHYPSGWLMGGDSDKVSYYAEHIERCVETILERVSLVADPGQASVAFPLIGTGEFGLPVEVFARLFFAAVASRARRCARPMHVAVVVLEPDILETVARAGTQVFASLGDGGEPLLKPAGGHPLVSRLRERPRRLADPILQEVALLQFAELATLVELCTLWDLQNAPVDQFFRRFRVPQTRTGTLTFGTVVQLVTLDLEVDGNIARSVPEWARERAAAWRENAFRVAIRRLVEDRNHVAHNRAPRAVSDVVADIEHLFGPDALPEAWPNRAGRFWIRELEGETAVIDSVDVEGGQCTWLRPLRRDRVREALAVSG